MPRLNGLDLVVVGVFFVGAVVIGVLALAGMSDAAVAGIGVMLAVYVVTARLNAAANRAARKKLRANLRAIEKELSVVRKKQKAIRAKSDVMLNRVKQLDNKFDTVVKHLRALREISGQRDHGAEAKITQEVRSLRPELRGIRVSQQLLSQSLDEAKTLLADESSAQDAA
ncbi:hypothetical protein [Nesterenkonia alba]|uniref:hypothetical protein n=1 Tax=Nesterenkonia alba TaxID=515814 RepID=UPI0003B3F0C8|nr:hypothetical protein [Nesterenkonia alba]